MRSILVVLATGLLIPAASTAQETPNAGTVSEILTEGTATRSARPDLATITFEFSAIGANPRQAGSNVAARADSLRRALQGLGVSRDSLVTGSRWYYWRPRIELLPQQPRYYPPPPGMTGPTRVEQDTLYRAHEAITARIRDVRKVGAVIDTALALGITQIGNIEFSLTRSDSLRDLVLRDATLRATRQATILAEASGGRLGRLIRITTQAPGGYSYDYSPLVARDAGLTIQGSQAATGSAIVEPAVPLTVTVYGRWELEK